ncbi:EamA family transporter [Streptomyces sp. 900105755]|uniref:EamA family transporter n=1 Tax=Streptomyces sp. NPDC001507 TaxID=3364579 RepID=UPI00368D829F
MTSIASLGRAQAADVVSAAVAPAVWGSTYLVTTELLPPGRPLLAAAVRALPAGLVLVAITRRLPHGTWIGRAVTLGLLNIGAFFSLLFVAAYRLPGGLAAIIGSVQPMIVILLAFVLLRERARLGDWAACALGTVGVGLLVLSAQARLDTVGVLAELAATTSMAAGIVLGKRWGRPEGVGLLAFTGWQLTAGGLFLLPLSLVVEGPPPRPTGLNLLGFTYLAVIGALVSYALWFRGIERLPAFTVSLLGFVSPVVATALGYVVLGQSLSLVQVCGAVLVLGAIRLAQRSAIPRPRSPSPPPSVAEPSGGVAVPGTTAVPDAGGDPHPSPS